jgi:cold shock CspA family protein
MQGVVKVYDPTTGAGGQRVIFDLDETPGGTFAYRLRFGSDGN